MLLAVALGLILAARLLAQTTGANTAATKAYESGLAAGRAGDIAKAESELERAVKLNPGSAEIQLALGQVLLQRGDYDGAAAHLRIVVRLNPNLFSVLFFLA